jgi:hypothetical protein
MTHNRDHIVIHSLAQPVSIGSEKPATKIRVWWFPASLVLAFFAGAIIF